MTEFVFQKPLPRPPKKILASVDGSLVKSNSMTKQNLGLVISAQWFSTNVELTVDPDEIVSTSLGRLWPQELHLLFSIRITRSPRWLQYSQFMPNNVAEASTSPHIAQRQHLSLFLNISRSWRWNGFTTELGNNSHCRDWNVLCLRKRNSLPLTDADLKMELPRAEQQHYDVAIAKHQLACEQTRSDVLQLEQKVLHLNQQLQNKKQEIESRQNQLTRLRQVLIDNYRQTNFTLLESRLGEIISMQTKLRRDAHVAAARSQAELKADECDVAAAADTLCHVAEAKHGHGLELKAEREAAEANNRREAELKKERKSAEINNRREAELKQEPDITEINTQYCNKPESLPPPFNTANSIHANKVTQNGNQTLQNDANMQFVGQGINSTPLTKRKQKRRRLVAISLKTNGLSFSARRFSERLAAKPQVDYYNNESL